MSVVLCTFNAGRFLQPQLDSILGQTYLPDELVVCDDRSEDETRANLKRFAESAPFPVNVTINKTRLGSTKNFERAIAAAQGDVIALADQDDVWRPDKIERLERAFNRSDGPSIAFSDARLVDEHLRPLGESLWESVGFSRREQEMVRSGRTFEVLLRHNVVTGATMAFRSELRSECLPIPEDWVHDGWMALIAAATGSLEPVPEELVDYRQHAGAQIGAGSVGLGRRVARGFADLTHVRRAEVRQYEIAAEHLHRLGVLSPERARHLEAKIEHARMRASLPRRRWRRLRPILSRLVSSDYGSYARGWKDATRDLLHKKESTTP